MAKLTLSLSAEARTRIDERAAALGITRSAFVESLVEAEATAEFEQLLEEGYRAMSAENLEFAERALPLSWEVIQRDGSAW
jgi:hypothetical protein